MGERRQNGRENREGGRIGEEVYGRSTITHEHKSFQRNKFYQNHLPFPFLQVPFYRNKRRGVRVERCVVEVSFHFD